MYITEATALRILRSLGGSGSVGSPQTQYMTEATGVKIAQALESGAAAAVKVIDDADTSASLTLEPCPTTYVFGEVAELTLVVDDESQYHFMFTCPSGTATVLNMTGHTGTAGDTLAAGKTYEVDVWAGVAFIKEIEITAVTP